MNKRQDSWQNRTRLHSFHFCLVEAATGWRIGIHPPNPGHLQPTTLLYSPRGSCGQQQQAWGASSLPPALPCPELPSASAPRVPRGFGPAGQAGIEQRSCTKAAVGWVYQVSFCGSFFPLFIPISNLVQWCQERYAIALSVHRHKRFLPPVARLWSPVEVTEPFDLHSCPRAACLPEVAQTPGTAKFCSLSCWSVLVLRQAQGSSCWHMAGRAVALVRVAENTQVALRPQSGL